MDEVCGECGAPAGAGEDFCGECGAYLEWEQRPAAAAGTPVEAASTEAGPEPARAGLVERVRAAVGVGGGDAAATGADQDPLHRAAEPGDPPATPAGTTARAAGSPEPSAARAADDSSPGSAAAAMVVGVPPAQPETGPRKPAAVQPGRPAPRTRRPTAHDREPVNPGDLVCGECGAGNKPTRKFCRRCGHDLSEAEVARVPWWRRILRRRPKAAHVAGTRPTTSSPGRFARIPRKVVVLLVVAAVLLGAGLLARDYVGGAVSAVADRVQGTEKVNPTRMRGSDASPDHPAKLARDGFTNRYWAPAAAGGGRGSFLVAEFEEPFRLVYLVITPGVSGKDEAAFLANGRPAKVEVVLTRADGGTEVETLELPDEVGPAEFNVATSDVSEVRIEILRSRGPKNTRTAIAEVEFLGR